MAPEGASRCRAVASGLLDRSAGLVSALGESARKLWMGGWRVKDRPCPALLASKRQLGSFGENGRRFGSTRWSCTVPCKEQARNRGVEPATLSCSRKLVLLANPARCPGCGAARNEVERCAADPGPPRTVTVPGLQRTTSLRLCCAAPGTRFLT